MEHCLLTSPQEPIEPQPLDYEPNTLPTEPHETPSNIMHQNGVIFTHKAGSTRGFDHHQDYPEPGSMNVVFCVCVIFWHYPHAYRRTFHWIGVIFSHMVGPTHSLVILKLTQIFVQEFKKSFSVSE